jgi:hypothetical protein
MICGEQQPATLDDSQMQDLLRRHYGSHKGQPALCLCTDVRPRMYIARLGEQFVLKRWPGSGHEHAVDCDRYEPPLEASGLGRLLGSAIREDTLTGDVELRLGFPLKKQPRNSAAPADARPEDQAEDDTGVKSASSRAGLRAILHYLFDQAELTHWKPGMKGKRNWWVVRTRLLDAAARMTAKGTRLNRRLFIPEPFKVETKDEIRLRRRALLQTVASHKAARDLMMFLVEVKDLSPSTYGYKLVARNVPDDPLYLSEDLFAILRRRFETELEMFSRPEGQGHLIAFGTLSVKPSGIATIEDMTLMATTAEWIPVCDETEAIVVDYAVATGRAFVKPLKYNMTAGRALAALLFTDCPDKPTAFYVVRPEETEVLVQAREELMQSTATVPVLWRLADDPIPTEVIDAIPSKYRAR